MSNENKDDKRYYAKLYGFRRVVPILLGALGIFIAVCFFTEGAGLLGGAVSTLLKGLFSFGAYFIPPLLLLHAIFYAGDHVKRLVISRTVFSIVTVLLVSAIEYIIAYWNEPVFDPSSCYATQSAGGFLGSSVGYALTKALGPVGLIILSVTVIAVYATYFFATGNSVASKSVMKIFVSTKDFFFGIFSRIKGSKEKKKAIKAEKERLEVEKHSDELLADSFFTSDDSISELKIEKLGISEVSASTEAEEVTPSPAEESVPAEAEPEKKFAERPKRTLNLDYGLGIEDTSSPKAEKASAPAAQRPASRVPDKATRAVLGLDESADDVFTKEFDPFDFATAEKIIARPRTASKSGISEITTPLSSVTERDVEAMKAKQAEQKRIEEFEERKRQIIENISSNTKDSVAASQAPDASASKAHEQAGTSYGSYASYTSGDSAQKTAESYGADFKSASSQPASAPTQSYSGMGAENGASYSASSASLGNASAGVGSASFGTASAEESRKSVAFNIADEKDERPGESDPVTFVFDKSEHYPDETQKIANEVAQMLEKNVTGYTRSANRSFTYMKVTESQGSSEQASGAAPGTDAYARPESLYDLSDDSREDIGDASLGSNASASSYIGQQAGGYSESKTGYNSVAASSDTSSITVNEYSTASSDTAPSEASFNEYRSPEISKADEQTNTDELRIERTLIEPTVEPEQSVITERDKQFTVLCPDKEADYDEDTVSEISDDDDGISKPAGDGTEFSFNDERPFAEQTENSEADISEIFGDDEDEEPEFDGSGAEDGTEEPEEIPPEEQNPEILKQRQMFPFLDNTTAAEASADETEDEEPPFDVSPAPAERAEPAVAQRVEPIEAKPEGAQSTALVSEKEAKKAKAPSYKNFKFPPIEMLGLNDGIADDKEAIKLENEENAERLIDTLSSFNVTASIKGVDRGPRITRYEVVPAKGVKVSAIMNLQDDIALNLAADGIRMEAPIPGKSAVGVEIPNKHSTTVRLRELLETEEFIAEKSKTAICIGKDVAGQPVINDIAKMPHLLIAGATGMGKSVCINSLLISILYKARPDEVKLIMIDPKQVEFTMYNGIPHLLIPVVSDAKQAAGALMWAVDEMEKRFTQLNAACVRNIDGYNERVAEDPSIGEPMSKIIIVIDEFADLMLQVKDPVESLVMRIAQKARAAGIHLIIGTQRPSTNVITGTIKANIPSRMSCKVASNVDSRTVLDSVGAEKLLNRGDMLFAYAGAIKPLRVQGAFVSDGEVQNIMNHLKQFSNGDNYDEAVMEEIKRQAAKCNKKGNDGDDDRDGDESSGEGFLNDRQFLEAVEVAVNSGKISTSLLQRKISIGYGKAAKFIDVMCDMGIVGESNGSKPREVLITPDEWREKLSRLSYD